MSELSENECFYMDKAFFYAKEALTNQEVPVGCVFIYSNQIIALGRNTVNETRNATRHAEINCIDQVENYCNDNNLNTLVVFSEISVYVTVEPCIMCAAALFSLKIKKIVYGCRNDRFGGQTVFDVASILNPVTELKGGYRGEEAMELLKEFYRGSNPNAPAGKAKVKKN
ncbi:unnamed protein product [Psylliodes chrysocephalus]|uniref:CMP/dCMP-type deaminase domain-containing protein n=1 Tax=Psylliodes chrysocephalus TaxID=3402493 RepID=A0A9P0GCA3_9CUCU|nr:unnamed protein product [Psylliodes chrysocephala]